MKFEVIYSQKIHDAVAVFTWFMFGLQYGLTREDVAENFSRTAPTWSLFVLYMAISFLLVFLVWQDDYILSEEGITCRRIIFNKKHSWDDFPYCGICYDDENNPDEKEKLLYFSKKAKSHGKFDIVCKTIEYTSEMEAIFQIYCPQMNDPDWEFWDQELKEIDVWNEEDIRNYKQKVFKQDVFQSLCFLPVLWALKFVDSYYIPVALIGIAVLITRSSFAKKGVDKIKGFTREYQRAALRQLLDEKKENL